MDFSSLKITPKGLFNAAAVGTARYINAMSIVGMFGDQLRKVTNPNDNIVTSLNDLRLTISNGGRLVPGHTRYRPAKKAQAIAMPTPVKKPPTPKPTAKAAPSKADETRALAQLALEGMYSRLSQAPPAPVLPPPPAAPVPPVVQAAPAPVPVTQQQPVVSQQAPPPQVQTVVPESDGIDYERRRAFLDAKDSLEGMKAVKALLASRQQAAQGQQ